LAGINAGVKYVRAKTMKKSIGKLGFPQKRGRHQKVKNSKGRDIQPRSGELVQLLLKNDLVDELWAQNLPLTLWQRKKAVGKRRDRRRSS